MKKTLSVILAVLMLIACMPFVLADDVTYFTDESGVFSGTDVLVSGATYEIVSGAKMTVPAGVTLNIPLNCTLRVAEGATLQVDGEITVSKSGDYAGRLEVYGHIINGWNVNGQGDRIAYVTFPGLASAGYSPDTLWVYQATGGGRSDYLTDGFSYSKVPVDGAVIPCPLNGYLFIKTDIVKDGDYIDAQWDDAKMNVTVTNHGKMSVGDEGIKYVQIVDAGTVGYSRWTSDDDFLKEYSVTLTDGKGYTLYDEDGNTGTVNAKFGKTFIFRVEFDSDYSYSSTTAEVILYNGAGVVTYDSQAGGIALHPDDFGWYRIERVTGDYTVYVSALPMNDDTVIKVGGIFQTIKNIFNMILEFFRQLAGSLGINVGGSSSAETTTAASAG
ncbi:MAG: hypothetical protein IJT27_03545 [Clostridia bacterium]|nr:hypothetical protein [Clostridia bacterium]